MDDQRHALDELLKALNTKVRPCLDEARQQPPFDVIQALDWTTKRIACLPDITDHDRVCLATAITVLEDAKHTLDTDLLAAARQALAMWDKYGMGDEEEDAETTYHQLRDAAKGYAYWRSRHDRTCPF